MATATSKKPRASTLSDAALDEKLRDVPPLPADAACAVAPHVPEFVPGSLEKENTAEDAKNAEKSEIINLKSEILPALDPPPSTLVSLCCPVAALPMDAIAAGRYHLSSHVEVQRLSLGQRTALRRLLIGLDQAGARLADGRRVAKNADVVRWLLEAVEAGFGVQGSGKEA